MRISSYTFILFGLLVFLVLAGQVAAEPYVQVQAEKIKASDLNRNAPPGFTKANRYYNGELIQILKDAGHTRLLELEAKSKKLSYDKYIEEINEDIVAPTEKDIRRTYATLKVRGAVGGKSLEQLRERIRRYILSFREKQAMRHEVNRLKKKYSFRLVAEHPEEYGVFIKGEPTQGNKKAKVTFVKYGDFLCYYCRRFMKTQRALVKQYGKKVRFVFKDVPFKPASSGIHAASSCVWKIKPRVYWKYFYSLYDDDNRHKIMIAGWREKRALRLGVNKKRFRACLEDPAVKAEIKTDLQEARSLGVQGTPTFFINGIKISGAQSLDKFRVLIDEFLEP